MEIRNKNPAYRLQELGFSVDDLDLCKRGGWTPEDVLKEVKRHFSECGSTEGSARAVFFEAYPELLRAEKHGSFDFYSITDLTEEEQRPPEFIIDGMLPVGMTFLSGAPKTRKSFLALQIAISVASGKPFFGMATTQCDVAYLDLEGSKSRISNRARHMSEEIPRNVYVTNRTEGKLADSLVEDLRRLHQQHPSFRLIIIDTYSRARGNYRGGGANAYDQDVAFLEPIQRMAIEENIAILFIHHDRKGAGLMADSFERLSGTMGISGSADCVMNLIGDGKRFDGKATLEYTPRDARGGELSLCFSGTEWQQLVTTENDLMGNPVCAWIIRNAPDARGPVEFFPYDLIFSQAYHAETDKPGEEIRRQVEKHCDELFTSKRIAVQAGAASHGKRGIRVMKL